MKTNNRKVSTMLVGLSCGMVLGCGATDETRVSPEGSTGGSTPGGLTEPPGTRLPAPGRPYELDEVYPEQAERTEASGELVDVIYWRSERIEFWNSHTAEDPILLTVRTGKLSEGDVLDHLETQTESTVTPAELWRAVTGRDDVPETLALDHRRTALLEGRSDRYQDFEPITTDKAQTFPNVSGGELALLHQTFPFQDSQHCWNGVKGISRATGSSVGAPNHYACTSQNPSTQSNSSFIRLASVTLATACPTFLNHTGAIRVVVSNLREANDPARDIVQHCLDNGTGSGWRCNNTSLMAPLTFVSVDMSSDPRPHRVGLGLTDATARNFVQYGAARRLTSPPIGQTCGSGGCSGPADGFCQ